MKGFMNFYLNLFGSATVQTVCFKKTMSKHGFSLNPFQPPKGAIGAKPCVSIVIGLLLIQKTPLPRCPLLAHCLCVSMCVSFKNYCQTSFFGFCFSSIFSNPNLTFRFYSVQAKKTYWFGFYSKLHSVIVLKMFV